MSRTLVAAALSVGLAFLPEMAMAAPAPQGGAVVLPVEGQAAPGTQTTLPTNALQGPQTEVATLSAAQRQALVRHLLNEKPNPGTYAIASALLPGAGELALGDWKTPALVWGALLLASVGVFELKTHQFGIHPAFLGTTPYVLTFGVNIPNTTPVDSVNDFYNRFLQIAYLGAAAWTGYQSYELALQKRQAIDSLAKPLHP